MPPKQAVSSRQTHGLVRPGAKTKTKPQKKEVDPQERTRRLYRSLCAQIDGGHFKNAIKTCDKILRVDAGDNDALQTKLFLLLQTEQYDMALTLLNGMSGYGASHEFEKAYTLYRLHHEAEAADVLSDLKGHSGVQERGVLHLEAQLAYRQGRYQAAFDTYSQLLDSSVASDEHADLLTNLNAAQTHLDFLNTGYLHALDALPAAVINTLEKAPPPAPPGTTATANAASQATAPTVTPGQARPAERRVRMSRVPNGVVPGVSPPPDPERWIKKSERTNFGQGLGKRRKAAAGGATQGSLAEAAPSHNVKSSSSKPKKKK